MYQTILIPIDFSIRSLHPLKFALSEMEHQNAKCHIVLMYSEFLSDSITDLLFYNPYRRLEELKSKEFIEALAFIKNRYESGVESIRIEMFHGVTVTAMKNFLEAKRIDFAFYSKVYRYDKARKAFDPSRLIKRSGIPFKEISDDETIE